MNEYCKGSAASKEVVKPGCLKAALERLEPCVGKLTSTVLMGLGFRNEPWLPDLLLNFPWRASFHIVNKSKIFALYFVT